MNDELYAELLESVCEGANILQGKQEPERIHQVSVQEAVSFLQGQRRQVLGEQFEILALYRADTLADLEAKIASGEIAGHPGWEDLTTAQSFGERLEGNDTLLTTP